MPYVVNGQLVTQDRVRSEEVRICQDAQWKNVPNEAERSRRIRESAEFSAIDVVLVEQLAASDPRPVNPELLERELRHQRTIGKCRGTGDDREVRLWIEWHLV
jgi:hypothetical protein